VRVVRCFAFLDLCGFTAYTEEHGDEQAVEVLAQLRAVMRAEAEDKGVRVTKWLGDGVMLSGVEPASVLECVATVRQRVGVEGRLALRGGVCAGPVIMFEGDDYIGVAVNTAARLCDAAVAGQVLTTAKTATHAPEGLRTTPLLDLPVRGLSAPVAVHELTPPALEEADPPPSGIVGP
jgi:adenylate cyclase